jgi:hypothetical protein
MRLMAETSPAPLIESRIYIIRGHKVLLDSDLAQLYQVETKALNRAVKRNVSAVFRTISCFNCQPGKQANF